MDDLRHDPGRGARHHEATPPRPTPPATTPPRCSSSAAPAPTGTTLDPGLGLPTDFALQIVTQVGNYGEIFEANLAPIGIDRAGPQRAVVRRRPAVRPAVPLTTRRSSADPDLTDSDGDGHRPTTVLARRPRPGVGVPDRRGRGGRRRRLVALRQLPRQRRAPGPQHRLRSSSTSRPASRSRRATFRQSQRDQGRHRRGLLQHAAAGDHRHRAGDGARHADRRRPAVAELRPAQRGAGLRRDRPQRAAAGAGLPGVHRHRPERLPAAERLVGRSARSPCSTSAASSVFWYEGDNWKARGRRRRSRWSSCSSSPAGAAPSPIAPAGRRAPALWAIPVGLVVAVRRVGRARSRRHDARAREGSRGRPAASR